MFRLESCEVAFSSAPLAHNDRSRSVTELTGEIVGVCRHDNLCAGGSGPKQLSKHGYDVWMQVELWLFDAHERRGRRVEEYGQERKPAQCPIGKARCRYEAALFRDEDLHRSALDESLHVFVIRQELGHVLVERIARSGV